MRNYSLNKKEPAMGFYYTKLCIDISDEREDKEDSMEKTMDKIVALA